MELVSCKVTDKKGVLVDAQKAVCPVCTGEQFLILVIKGHNHLQCANPVCNESFCQGGNCE